MDSIIVSKEQKSEIVFQQLKAFVIDVLGNDVVEEIGISKESVFTKDLEMDSIKIVIFAEKVKTKYGPGIDFISWLSKMNFLQLYNLSIGQVVEYIVNGSDAN